MIRLLYISQWEEGVTDDIVQAILQSASRNNPPRGITGVLVYAGRAWAQVMEGPEQHVLQTYLTVAADKRHRNCRIVYVSMWANASLITLPWRRFMRFHLRWNTSQSSILTVRRRFRPTLLQAS